MWKKAIVGAAALMIAGSIIVYAQQRPEAPTMSVETGALRAGIARDLAKMRMDRFATARDLRPPSDPVARLQRRADALSVRGAALKRLAETLAPIYQSFDEGQKRRFTILARFMRSHPRHFGQGRGEMDVRGGIARER
jgi:hypothetical protein